ncbi:putative alpha/beta hydrolase-3 [Septoria linicola]|nr:putative alpha/beta hydrolase-3 [Septoria linicola]
MCDFTEYGGASQQLLDLLVELPIPVPDTSIEELKKATNQGREDRSREELAALRDKISLKDHAIEARDGYKLEARSYRPSSIPTEVRLPIYIHYHGGGFIFGTLSSEDATCARIALASDVVVLNVNYRHTPEWRYPTAWHDSEDAFEWAVEKSNDFGGDSSHTVVGGVSAGGQLAAALTLTKKREKANSYASIRGQILMIPCLAHIDTYEYQLKQLRDPSTLSYKENEFAPILPVSRLNLMNGLLHTQAPLADDRRINVGAASANEVQGLPPTVFGIAGLDPLRDEALLYAKALAESGVATDVHLFKGVPHGFRRFGDKLSASRSYDKVMHDGIRWALSHPPANIEMVVHVHE